MSDGDVTVKEVAKDSSVARSHSTFDNIFTWLKKRRKIIFHQSQSGEGIDALAERSSSTVKMNDQYRSSTAFENLDLVDNDEVAMAVSEEADPQPQSYNTDDTDDTDTDDALDDSLSTVKMSELVLSSSKSSVRLVHEALEYERCLRTQTV